MDSTILRILHNRKCKLGLQWCAACLGDRRQHEYLSFHSQRPAGAELEILWTPSWNSREVKAKDQVQYAAPATADHPGLLLALSGNTTTAQLLLQDGMSVNWRTEAC